MKARIEFRSCFCESQHLFIQQKDGVRDNSKKTVLPDWNHCAFCSLYCFSLYRRRFNLKNANWKEFSDELDHRKQHVQATPDNCNRFSKIVRTAAQNNTSGGRYINYISGLTTSACQIHFKYKSLLYS